MQPVADLIALAEHLATLPEPWAANVAARLDRVLAGEDVAVAFGLKPTRGRRRWRTVTAIDRRDELLRQTVARFWPGMRPSRAAGHLARELRRYSASSWRFDQAKADCPCDPTTLRAHLWMILRLVDNALSDRRIRGILCATRI